MAHFCKENGLTENQLEPSLMGGVDSPKQYAASRKEPFVTLNNNQEALRFEIYQGEGYFASENLKLGEVVVRVPPTPAGEQSTLVTFTYDID